MATSPKVDTYIEKAKPFAQPILAHLRQLLHAQCPEAVEDIKWGIPHFDYRGEFMCIMAASAKHCSFTFWKQEIMSDPRLQANLDLKADKRFLGKLTSLADLPEDAELTKLIKEAMDLNERGVKLPERAPKTPAEVATPTEFQAALDGNAAAKAVFEAKSPSFRKDYLVWIADAKTPATRQKRIDEALGWIAEGKGRFWKYQK